MLPCLKDCFLRLLLVILSEGPERNFRRKMIKNKGEGERPDEVIYGQVLS
jgi:hypothetical protein